jgi:hypothetical protein
MRLAGCIGGGPPGRPSTPATLTIPGSKDPAMTLGYLAVLRPPGSPRGQPSHPDPTIKIHYVAQPLPPSQQPASVNDLG